MGSIYIQVTDKCNMSCAHCCFSCTGKGSFMSQDVFDRCLELAVSRELLITLGGGEPTLHPKLLDWAMQASVALVDLSVENGFPYVFIITNGKKAKTACKLAKMSKLGIIGAELSQDEWHEPIDPKTVETFRRYARVRKCTPLNQGRARDNRLSERNECACEGLFITPNGDFYGCGCKHKRYGNIFFDEVPDLLLEEEVCDHDREIAVQTFTEAVEMVANNP